jgi:hypothetical protein
MNKKIRRERRSIAAPLLVMIQESKIETRDRLDGIESFMSRFADGPKPTFNLYEA